MTTTKYKLGRLVTSKAWPSFEKLLTKLILKLENEDSKLSYFIFPGGFFEIDIDKRGITREEFYDNHVLQLIDEKFNALPRRLRSKLTKRIKFFSIGIDGCCMLKSGNQHPIIQSVILYSNKRN
jgi:hypothetical protein